MVCSILYSDIHSRVSHAHCTWTGCLGVFFWSATKVKFAIHLYFYLLWRLKDWWTIPLFLFWNSVPHESATCLAQERRSLFHVQCNSAVSSPILCPPSWTAAGNSSPCSFEMRCELEVHSNQNLKQLESCCHCFVTKQGCRAEQGLRSPAAVQHCTGVCPWDKKIIYNIIDWLK